MIFEVTKNSTLSSFLTAAFYYAEILNRVLKNLSKYLRIKKYMY